MKTAVLLPLAASGCNWTPAPWPDPSAAPGGNAPWSHPTDDACEQKDDPSAFEVDGFTFCGMAGALHKVPVDEPRFEPCDERARGAGELLAVFDGIRARGYALDALHGRELVHDTWDGEPILVDF